MIEQPQDIDLIQGIAAGKTESLDMLYARYGSAVLNFLMARTRDRQTAEEVLQDVMMAIWRGAKNFREESRVLTWMLTIARNRAINAQRRKQPDIVVFEDELNLKGHDTEPLEKVVKLDRASAIRDAIDLLPEHHREVLILVFYHSLSGAEVAEVLGISVGTVKSRLHRAKETLRGLLHSEEVL
jgi:RNA polymerase sigma-70 factor (ECF subfamily)